MTIQACTNAGTKTDIQGTEAVGDTELEEGLIDRHKRGVAGAALQLHDFGEHKYPGCEGWLMAIPWMESGEFTYLSNAAIIQL
jgi:hypothetical protein